MIRRSASLWILGFSLVVFVFAMPAPAEPTFSFEIETDTIEFTDGNNTFTFPGVVQNLLDIDQNLIYSLTPVYFPNPRRHASICTWMGCFPPTEGTQTRTVAYTALQNDAAVSFDIYNAVATDSFPAVLPVSGDYIFDVRVYAQGEPDDYIEYRFVLDDLNMAVEPLPVPVPLSHQLLSNYPNPFNPSTNINFVVENTGPIKITVFDILGRTVADLVNANYSTGSYTLNWDAKSNTGVTLPSGSYWVQLNTPNHSTMHRIVLLR
jgi:hypothetical protein